MRTAVQQLTRQWAVHVPYPLALQSLVSLVLLATLPSALETGGGIFSLRFALLCVLVGLYLTIFWIVPVRQLRLWHQLTYLALQVALASLTQGIMPSQLLGYMYLVIVLQAVYLFKPFLWIAFAGCVYILWSGLLMIASTSLLDWAHGNLMLAFPVLCILIAAALYVRQHRRHEQVEHVLQQMQRQYDTLLLLLRDAAESAALAERQRLAQTIASDIATALAQTEQSIASAISQAQTNFACLGTTITQTRATAAAMIDRTRAAVANLRRGVRDDSPPSSPAPAIVLPPAELMTLRSQQALLWILPLAFVAIALSLVLLQHSATPTLAGLFALCCVALVGGYVFTQRIHNPLWVHVGLVGQAVAVLGMVFVTQALPLTLGLLLVAWQIAMRLSAGQIVTFFVGVQTIIGLALTHVLPVSTVTGTQLLSFCVACVAVVGLVGLARRQLNRRRLAEMHLRQLASLTSELEQQLTQARTLATAVERTRLAREIHDDLGHRLVLVNIQLQLIEDLIEDEPDAALNQLRSTHEQLREAWASAIGATDMVLNINGATLALALDRLVAECRELTSIHIELRIIGDLRVIDTTVACALYRAVQEGLTNTCKYAQAEHAHVLVSCDDVMARVSVRDDGKGSIPPQASAGDEHFGLAGLRERAESLGGTVEAGLLPEGGFLLSMTIPLP